MLQITARRLQNCALLRAFDPGDTGGVLNDALRTS
jgi:hypothetical protein